MTLVEKFKILRMFAQDLAMRIEDCEYEQDTEMPWRSCGCLAYHARREHCDMVGVGPGYMYLEILDGQILIRDTHYLMASYIVGLTQNVVRAAELLGFPEPKSFKTQDVVTRLTLCISKLIAEEKHD